MRATLPVIFGICCVAAVSALWVVVGAAGAWHFCDFALEEGRRGPPRFVDYVITGVTMYLAAAPGVVGLVCSVVWTVRVREAPTRSGRGFDVTLKEGP